MEDLDIDLYDFPLDYEVVQEGDYYDDGVTPAENIPWLYTIVNPGFSFPAGIQYEILQYIHVPVLASIENEAFRLTGNPIDDTTCSGGAISSSANIINGPDDAGDCPNGYTWDPILRRCVKINPGPPAPAPTRQPSGTITVFDNNLNTNRPVRNARVVARRFLKVERTYTNNQGQFFINKEFRKVTLLVKFKNDQAKIRALRRARLWQMLFPVKIKMGKYKGALNNIVYNIDYFNDALSRGARHWAAATAHNNVQEYYDYAVQLGMGAPPAKLRILLTNWRLQGVSGAAPMYAKRVIQELPEDFLRYYLISTYTPFSSFAPWLYVLKNEIDITMGYNRFNILGTDQTANSDRLSELAFHELTHAAHYNKVGNSWWNDFVNAELNEMIFSGNSPYGNGDNGTTSAIIGLGESWAYHMGHFMADRKYGLNSSSAFEQGITYQNNVPIAGISSHLNLLEDFDPVNRPNDPFRWIPQGLYYDLFDNRNENVPVIDAVNNYTNQQFFNALDNDINNLPAYRQRLLDENGNNQAIQVTNLFNAYGY